MKEARLMYLGMRENYGDFSHIFVEINEDNTLGQRLRYNKKMFTRGSIGAVFSCKLDGSSISYNPKAYASYVLEVEEGRRVGTSILFKDEIDLAQVKNDQAVVAKRNQTKTKSNIDTNIDEIRDVYKRLSSAYRSRFIADLVYKITK